MGFFIINHPAIGVPPWLWKPPYKSYNKQIEIRIAQLVAKLCNGCCWHKISNWSQKLTEEQQSCLVSWTLPSGNLTQLLKITIHSWFMLIYLSKMGLSKATLVYQRITGNPWKMYRWKVHRIPAAILCLHHRVAVWTDPCITHAISMWDYPLVNYIAIENGHL